MKAPLLSLVLFLCATFHLSAQPCDLQNLTIVSTDGDCTATVSFDMRRNNGNKFIYLHLWNEAEFAEVNKPRFQKGAGPLKIDIDGIGNSHPSLATVAIDNNDFNHPKPSSLGYRPDPTEIAVNGYSVTVSSTPVSGSGNKAYYRYTVSNIPLGSNINGGCNTDNLNAIVWSTQANSQNSHIHCSAISLASSSANIIMAGSASCITRQYTLNLVNQSLSNITIKRIDIYADNGGSGNDNIFDPGTGIVDDKLIQSITNYTVAANTTSQVTGTIPPEFYGFNLWAQAVFSDNSTQLEQLATTSCGALPVKMQNFSVSRINQNVALSWQTSSEQNMRGFEVERSVDNSEWESVGFVHSKAMGGNSTATLNYSFTDANNHKGVSQYRLKEVATDGKFSYSEVRLVRGNGVTNKLTMYPNPTITGSVNLVFSDPSTRDVQVLDMAGRMVKQFKSVPSTNIAIRDLQNGLYTVQVIDRITGEILTEKLVVKSH